MVKERNDKKVIRFRMEEIRLTIRTLTSPGTTLPAEDITAKTLRIKRRHRSIDKLDRLVKCRRRCLLCRWRTVYANAKSELFDVYRCKKCLFC